MTNPVVVFEGRTDPAPVLSFLLPVYNERSTLPEVLKVLATFPRPHEVIVVDDGSTDGTRDILRAVATPGVAVLFHGKNQGKGAAIRTALAHARGEFTAIQDADLEYDPAEYVSLLTAAAENGVPAVFGSRFLTDNPNLYKRFLWGNKLMTAWINFLCGGRYTDTYTCFKLLQTALFRDLGLTSHGFEMEAEICVKLARRGLRPIEVPIRYRPRRVEEGKKIGLKDFFRGAWTALRGVRAGGPRSRPTPTPRPPA